MVHLRRYTVEPIDNGQFGSSSFVLYMALEVVLSQRLRLNINDRALYANIVVNNAPKNI